MKKIIIFFSVFIVFSFFFTSLFITSIENNDSLMQEIKNKSTKYQVKAINAEITGNSIISGSYGQEIDYHKSYYEMKKYGTYNEMLMCFKGLKPTISIEDNYDKYLIGGNKTKREISLVFIGNYFTRIISILDKEKVEGTFFIDGINITKNSNLIKNSNHEFEILNYDNSYNKSLFKTSIAYLETLTNNKCGYCYTVSDNNELLNLCKSLKLHTVKPTIIVNNNLYAKVKHNLDNSIIISISINKYTERELTTTIRYLKSKGYNIVTLNNLLIEKN